MPYPYLRAINSASFSYILKENGRKRTVLITGNSCTSLSLKKQFLKKQKKKRCTKIEMFNVIMKLFVCLRSKIFQCIGCMLYARNSGGVYIAYNL